MGKIKTMKETQEILLLMGFENINNNIWTSDIFGVFILHKEATPKQLAEFIYRRGQTSIPKPEVEAKLVTNVEVYCSYQIQDTCNFKGVCLDANCNIKPTVIIDTSSVDF